MTETFETMREIPFTRRELGRRAAASIAALGAAPALLRSAAASAEEPKRFRKAVKIGMVRVDAPLVEKFRLLRRLGFDGVELDSPSGLSRDEVARAREETGLPVHGVVDSVHWRHTLSHPDPAIRAKGVEALETAIRDSKAYGGSTVLLVPAVVNKEVSYDDAYKRSQEEVRKVLPLAAELEIKIAFENVWNNFLLSPLEFARYIDELESPWVGAYFDVGNVVNYGWPEQWVRILGRRIVKLDIKEYSRSLRDRSGPSAGFRVELLEGDCDWPAVMKALRDVGFEGWGTAEIPGGGEERLKEIAARMDRIFAS